MQTERAKSSCKKYTYTCNYYLTIYVESVTLLHKTTYVSIDKT